MRPDETYADGNGTTRADLRLHEKAVRERWDIAPEVRQQILKSAIELCTARKDDGTLKKNSRTVIAAMRVIVAFDRLSLEQKKIDAAAPPPPEEVPESGGMDSELAAEWLRVVNEWDARRKNPPPAADAEGRPQHAGGTSDPYPVRAEGVRPVTPAKPHWTDRTAEQRKIDRGNYQHSVSRSRYR